MDNDTKLIDITHPVKKLEERLLFAIALLDDMEIEKAKKILRDITGS